MRLARERISGFHAPQSYPPTKLTLPGDPTAAMQVRTAPRWYLREEGQCLIGLLWFCCPSGVEPFAHGSRVPFAAGLRVGRDGRGRHACAVHDGRHPGGGRHVRCPSQSHDHDYARRAHGRHHHGASRWCSHPSCGSRRSGCDGPDGCRGGRCGYSCRRCRRTEGVGGGGQGDADQWRRAWWDQGHAGARPVSHAGPARGRARGSVCPAAHGVPAGGGGPTGHGGQCETGPGAWGATAAQGGAIGRRRAAAAPEAFGKSILSCASGLISAMRVY